MDDRNMANDVSLICFWSSFQSEIGFGKIESYIKLDKVGEVSNVKVDSIDVVAFYNELQLIEFESWMP